MARIDTLPHYLEDIANVLRKKTGATSSLIAPKNYDEWIENIAPRVDVNGTIKKYTLQGDSVRSGDFIAKVDENNVKLYTSNEEPLLGIAAVDGSNGQLVDVYCPNTVVPYNIKITHNEGDSGLGFIQTTDDTWVSNNKGVPLSYSKCRIVLKTWKTIDITIKASCYTTDSQDIGIMGKLDQVLASTNVIPIEEMSQRILTSSTGEKVTKVYRIPADGETHFIEVKYVKDGKDNAGEDCLYFYIDKIEYVS